MLISVQWLHDYLPGDPMSVADIEAALLRAGFPIESETPTDDGDTVLDVEVTSNRGDCLCHVGVAREIAAVTGRELRVPSVDISGLPRGKGGASDSVALRITDPKDCPRFTARVIKGVRVGPSPEWMRKRLEAVGVKSINNLVDVSNYILMETGQPNHIFDLDLLKTKTLTVRRAVKGETVVGLDDETHKLLERDVVIDDGERVVSIAGVIGGRTTAVSDKTKDIVLEAATWVPGNVRGTSRRLKIQTDAGYRYERLVDQRQIDAAAARLAALVIKIAGGTLEEGVVIEPDAMPADTVIAMRTKRCEDLLGIEIPRDRMRKCLHALGIQTAGDDDTMACTIPAWRPDLQREVDLIEEVARIHGLDAIPIHDRLEIEVKPLQTDRLALRELANALVGAGFYETVTFSFCTLDEAKRFMPDGLETVAVDEERRKGAPALRPSVIPSLLHCRKANQDGAVQRDGGVRLFEVAPVYAQTSSRETVENRNLALLMDAPDVQSGVRTLLGAVSAVVRTLGGLHAEATIEACEPHCGAFRKDAFGRVFVEGAPVGYLGALTHEECDRFDLAIDCVGAEVNLEALLGLYPPTTKVTGLAAHPAIERDLSVVVSEDVQWATLAKAIHGLDPALMVDLSFVGVYRGKQVGSGKKSVTLRMRFQDPDRTLRHDEVDPQVEAVVVELQKSAGATLRV